MGFYLFAYARWGSEIDEIHVDGYLVLHACLTGFFAAFSMHCLPYRCNLLSSNPKATVKGNILTWTIELDDCETATVYYEYERLSH